MGWNKNLPYNELPNLPPNINLETTEILKNTIYANKVLAELKGYCHTLPNPNLLLNTIALQESKESNAIENIVTTQDELYRATIGYGDEIKNPSTKEVLQYRTAMYWGLDQIKENGFITINLLIGLMQKLRNTDETIRRNPGVKIANPLKNEVIYTPPEGEGIIFEKLSSLEKFINNESLSNLDPLIKMALIHYQFEAIHPFNDGNGRTGRLLIILYLISKNLISMPVLYLSYYIIKNKDNYYRLLKEVTEKENWEEWVNFIIIGVGETAQLTLNKINKIQSLKLEYEIKLKETLKSSFTKELSELLFSYPYIKIKILEEYNIAKRQTASDYLKKIEKASLLTSTKVGNEIYYINHQLMQILANDGDFDSNSMSIEST